MKVDIKSLPQPMSVTKETAEDLWNILNIDVFHLVPPKGDLEIRNKEHVKDSRDKV